MKNNFVKKITCLVIAIFMSSMFCNYALAEEMSETTTHSPMNGNMTVSDPFEGADYDTISENGQTVVLEVPLASYFGLTRKFYVTTTSNSTQGAVFLFLYNPSGKLVSDDWITSINGTYEWTLFLPSSGTYRLECIAQGTDAPVDIFVRFQQD